MTRHSEGFAGTIVLGVIGGAFVLFFVVPLAFLTINLWLPQAKEALRQNALDIPVFPGAELLREGQSGMLGEEYQIFYKAPGSTTANEVLDFYRAKLTAQGWEVSESGSIEGTWLEFERSRGKRISVKAGSCLTDDIHLGAWGDKTCGDLPREIFVAVH